VTSDQLAAHPAAIDLHGLDRAILAALRREAARRRNKLDELLADLDHALVMAPYPGSRRPARRGSHSRRAPRAGDDV